MTDQELQILKQVLDTAGAVGSQGFAALSRYTFANGVAWLIGAGAMLCVAIVGALVAFRKKDFDDDARATLFIGSCMVTLVAIFTFFSYIPDVIEPQGTTVRDLVHEATKK